MTEKITRSELKAMIDNGSVTVVDALPAATSTSSTCPAR